MNTSSIYVEAPKQIFSARDKIAAYASELETCEKLMSMGYTHSGRQSLSARAKYLEGEIKRIEDTFKS